MSDEATRPAHSPEVPAAYLEAQYNNRTRVPEHPAIIAGWQRDAAIYREALGSRHRRIAYATSARCILDVFAPAEDRTPETALLFVHGGYWQGLDPGVFSHLARGLNARGHLVALAGYDLCPAVGIGTIVDQIRRACAALAARGRRPVVAGHSAGGHLAACMLATDWTEFDAGLRPDLVPSAYAISGLFDLVPLLPTSVNRALGLDAGEAERQSPLAWAPPTGRVLDAVVGAEEGEEYHRQSRALAAAWGAGGVATRYAAEAGNHFTVIAPLADPDSAMTGRLAELVCAAAS